MRKFWQQAKPPLIIAGASLAVGVIVGMAAHAYLSKDTTQVRT